MPTSATAEQQLESTRASPHLGGAVAGETYGGLGGDEPRRVTCEDADLAEPANTTLVPPKMQDDLKRGSEL